MTLADLDEALFAVEGVLDFATALSPTTLHTEADGVDAAAKQVLKTHSLIQSVGLNIVVKVQQKRIKRTGKRQLPMHSSPLISPVFSFQGN